MYRNILIASVLLFVAGILLTGCASTAAQFVVNQYCTVDSIDRQGIRLLVNEAVQPNTISIVCEGD